MVNSDREESDEALEGEELASSTSKVCFADDFKPGENHVIIGRGKKCYKHIGNEKLQTIVASRLEEYSAATCKNNKSSIIMSIVTEIRKSTPGGGFIKQDPESKLWYDVGDFLAREKISQAFRDALQGVYKSSQKNKKKRRQEERTHLPMVKRSRASPTTQLHMAQSPMSQLVNGNLDSDNSHELKLPPRLLEYDNPFEPTPLGEGFLSSETPGSSEKIGEYLVKDQLNLDTKNEAEGISSGPYRNPKSTPNIRAAWMA